MNLRTAAAVNAGKVAGAVARRTGRGGGTALPGLVAERVDPAFVAHLGRQLGRGRVLVTGTNGKTTTTRILAQALTEAGEPYLHNREGSNLMRGLASLLLGAAAADGRIPRAAKTLGLFETDEATLPAAAAALAPTALAFTNLFRDQLDRYGEVDTVAGFWRAARAASPRDATLVLNADDPSVAELATGWGGPVHWFGLDDPAFASDSAGAFDARWCACGGSYVYDRRYFAHIGHWRCTKCDRARPTPQTSGRDVRLELDSATFREEGLGELRMPLTGLYNVYNALAAVALAKVLLVPAQAVVLGLASVEAAFGRQEVVELEGRRVRLLLCKNPAGANQILRLLEAVTTAGGPPLRVAVLLNDRFADGQDVSWIWDIDFEILAERVTSTWAGGDRAADMALRLKYAGWPTAAIVTPDHGQVLDAILRESNPGEDVFVIATYTAMLDLRATLVAQGAAAQFWK